MSILSESISNLTRNKFLSLASIISIGLILSIFNILISVNTITKNQINELSEKINLNIYIDNKTDIKEIEKIEQFLNNLNEVEYSKVYTAANNLEIMQKKFPESSNFITEFQIDNPLPYTIQIKTKQLEDNQRILNILEQSEFQPYIFKSENKNHYNQTITTVINNLIKIKTFSFQILLWVIITFIVAGTLIIFNAIKTTLFNRRNEVQIMQFVGATFRRIMTPFIIEGTLIGATGFILSIVLTLVLGNFLPFETYSNFSNISFVLIQLFISGLIGMSTSAYVVNKYLNTREIFHDQ